MMQAYFTEIHKIVWISDALIMARTHYNKRFQSYLVSPKLEPEIAIIRLYDVIGYMAMELCFMSNYTYIQVK